MQQRKVSCSMVFIKIISPPSVNRGGGEDRLTTAAKKWHPDHWKKEKCKSTEVSHLRANIVSTAKSVPSCLYSEPNRTTETMHNFDRINIEIQIPINGGFWNSVWLDSACWGFFMQQTCRWRCFPPLRLVSLFRPQKPIHPFVTGRIFGFRDPCFVLFNSISYCYCTSLRKQPDETNNNERKVKWHFMQ